MSGPSPSRPQSRPQLPLLIVVVVAVLLVGVAIVAAAVGDGAGPAALTVGSHRESQSALDAELHSLAGSKALADSLGSQGAALSRSRGSITSDIAAQWVSQRVYGFVVADLLVRRHLTVTAADRATAREQIGDAFLTGVSTDVVHGFVDVNAGIAALTAQIGQDQVNTVVSDALRAAKVRIDARYGSWDAKLGQVCSPSGCPAPTSG